MELMDNHEIDKIVEMLDTMTGDEISRIKIMTSSEVEEGEYKKEYHHGRCDVNSPWARGCSFDVLE